MLTLNDDGAPLLNIFGGKITTYRRLAQAAMEKLGPAFPSMTTDRTADASLPGGDFAVGDVQLVIDQLRRTHQYLTGPWATRLVRAYGTQAADILGGAQNIAQLGQCFGPTLYETEVIWLMQHEYARTGKDVVWRRTKLGLRMSQAQIKTLNTWMKNHRAAQTEARSEKRAGGGT